MNHLTNSAIQARFDEVLRQFNQGIAEVLSGETNLGFIEDSDPDLSRLLMDDLTSGRPTNILEGYLFHKGKPLPGNYMLFFTKCLDLGSMEQFTWNQLYITSGRETFRRHLCECLLYVRQNVKNCDPYKAQFLSAIATFIRNGGARDRF